jgi:HTH-type transcriptional regulator/antitoxin HigA
MTKEDHMAEKLSPAEVFPPGEFLSDELEARGWSQQEFAEIIGRPPNAVSQIINGKRSITPATAKELAAALGTSPMFWLNLEAAYRLCQTDDAPNRIAVQARLRSRYPVRYMVQRGWIEDAEDPEVG